MLYITTKNPRIWKKIRAIPPNITPIGMRKTFLLMPRKKPKDLRRARTTQIGMARVKKPIKNSGMIRCRLGNPEP
jgi:hypothetical protein